MILKYHQAIFDCLETEPEISLDAVALLRQQEEEGQFRYPEAVREWFSLKNAAELFFEHSNNDELTAIEELLPLDYRGQKILHVATENQGVLYWFATLEDGNDNPPVFHDDNEMEWDDDDNFDFSEVELKPFSYGFSAFIFAMMTEMRFAYAGLERKGTDVLPDTKVLDSLKDIVSEGPRTEREDFCVYRFFAPEVCLFIRSESLEAIAANQAEWILRAGTPQALQQLIAQLGERGIHLDS